MASVRAAPLEAEPLLAGAPSGVHAGREVVHLGHLPRGDVDPRRTDLASHLRTAVITTERAQ